MPSRAVLFDFDGTLADTAPDLAAAVNRMLEEQGHEPLPLERLRPFASAGARGLLQVAFGLALALGCRHPVAPPLFAVAWCIGANLLAQLDLLLPEDPGVHGVPSLRARL